MNTIPATDTSTDSTEAAASEDPSARAQPGSIKFPASVSSDHPGPDDEGYAESLLAPGKWPVPSWFESRVVGRPDAGRLQNYEAHLVRQSRIRYVELESDFLSVYGNFHETNVDHVTAGRTAQLLHTAKTALEYERPSDLLSIASLLDLIERYMVWVYPLHVLHERAVSVETGLRSFQSAQEQAWSRRLSTELEKQIGDDLRSVLDEAIGAINRRVLEEQMSSALQIDRLRNLWQWGLVLLGVLLAVSPFAVRTGDAGTQEWPSSSLVKAFVDPVPLSMLILVTAWINASSIALAGATGGYLSGLLQARNSRVKVAEYMESIYRLKLRPLVGAVVALLLYELLSWQVLARVSIQNPGSFFLLALVAGFSERYFLRLLDVQAGSSPMDDSLQAESTPNPADSSGGNNPSHEGTGGGASTSPAVVGPWPTH